MPIETKITLKYTPSDLPERMARYPEENHRRIMRFMNKAGLTLKQNTPPYPPPSRKPQPFKTERQRRFFFAALRDGRIVVPYRRTGQLGRSMQWEIVSQGPAEYRGRYGTNLAYAPLVISDDRQAGYHRGTWYTMKTIQERAAPTIIRDWEQTVKGMANFLAGR